MVANTPIDCEQKQSTDGPTITKVPSQSKFDYSELETDVRSLVERKTTEIRNRMGESNQRIVEIGERLISVKAALPHGAFGRWIEAEFEWTDRTARNFMNVATTFKSEAVADLPISATTLYLLASESTPAEVRRKLVARAKAGETVTAADVKQAIAAEVSPKPVEESTVTATTDTAGVAEARTTATIPTATEGTEPATSISQHPDLEAALAELRRCANKPLKQFSPQMITSALDAVVEALDRAEATEAEGTKPATRISQDSIFQLAIAEIRRGTSEPDTQLGRQIITSAVDHVVKVLESAGLVKAITTTTMPKAGGVGLGIGQEAIALLKTIPPKDSQRAKALDLVADWIERNRAAEATLRVGKAA